MKVISKKRKVNIESEGVDIGKMMCGLSVDFPVNRVPIAKATMFIREVDIEYATLKINGIDATEEIKNALREYFSGGG